MSKTRITLTIDDELLEAVKLRAVRARKSESEVLEEALRRQLGFDLLEGLWSRNDLSETEAMDLALEAQRAARRYPTP